MSYYYHTHYDHPFSYSVRRSSALSRVGTTLWESVFPQQSAAADLHDKALTAQPPIRKRHSHHKDDEALLGVVQDIVVIITLTVAAGIVARVLVQGLSSLWPNNNRKDNAE